MGNCVIHPDKQSKVSLYKNIACYDSGRESINSMRSPTAIFKKVSRSLKVRFKYFLVHK